MKPQVPSTSKKCARFCVEENKLLAAKIEEHPEIWNLQNKLHSNANVVTAAWKSIAADIGKSVAECKAAWKSLRDGRRYRIKKRKSSGSSADLEFEEVAENLEWEYEEYLRFLIPTQTMRKTLSSSNSTINEYQESEDDATTNYTYRKESMNKQGQLVQEVLSISETIRGFIEDAKAVQSQPQPQPDSQKHHVMLSNIDRMLQQLPQEKVEQFNAQWTVQLYNAILEQKRKQIQN